MSDRQKTLFFLKFIGLGLVVGVAYVDPGNWGTDIAAGSKFGYSLLWVVIMSNLIGIFMQYLSSKLGIATGMSLSENCSKHLTKSKSLGLWISAEIAVIATDLAEVVGAAIALYLLFKIPLIYGAVLTGLDTLLILGLERFGMRKVEAVIIGMMVLIGSAYLIEIYFAQPDWNQIAYHAIVPQLEQGGLIIAVGILGATVMPHAIYAHSALSRDRASGKLLQTTKQNCLKATKWDVSLAMALAGLVNIGIFLVGAINLYGHNVENSIVGAHAAITASLGVGFGALFAIGLLASGIASSSVGTYASGVITEGLLKIRLSLHLS